MKNTKAILETPGKMVIKDADFPHPGKDEVLLKVDTVGICGSDVHGFESGPFIPPKDPNQEIGLGHECAGVIVEVGENVTDFKPGDRVCIEPGVPCGECEFCLSGHYKLCPDVDFMATQPNYRGALTNYLVHPASFTFHLPDNMDMTEGALVEPASVGMHAAMMGEARPGKKIVILGAGCIGLMTLQACKAMGANEIIVIDRIEKRLNKAKELGAKAVVDTRSEDAVQAVREIFGDLGADVVFETAGAQATARMAPELVKRGGKIMIVGTIPGETPIDFLKINREVTIQTVFRYANCYPTVIDAISSGRFDVKSMVTDVYPYQDVQRAFEESISRKDEMIKGVIKMEED